MSEKSIYKKATGDGWDYNPDNARAKENQFFDEISSEKVGKKKKAQPKTVERADHKHEYAPAIVWEDSWLHKGKKVFHTASVCPICGREEHFNFRAYFCQDKEKEIPYLGELPHFERVEGKEDLVKIERDKYARKVFIGGSRVLEELSVTIKNELVEYMHAGATFLIGEGKGADLLVQKFLAKNGYRKVLIYTTNEKAKINVGFWEEKQVNGYGEQDKTPTMANDADEGFMLFKENSAEVMANVERLVAQGKTCKVAFKRKGYGNVYYREIRDVGDERSVEWLKRELDEITSKVDLTKEK
jgi:hypothetical protein